MGEALGAVLVFAVGVGLSPIPIIAAVLMLFSERAAVNAPLFLAGWLAGLTSLFCAFYLLADALDLAADTGVQDGVSWLRLVVGVLLVVVGARKLQHLPGPEAEPSLPGWMTRLDQVRPSRALGLAVLLSFNPKNLVLGAGAAASLAQLSPSTGQVVVATAVFVGVGSAVTILAVAYDLVGGDRAQVRLDAMKSWLKVHHTAVMATLFLVFGAVLISQGLSLRS